MTAEAVLKIIRERGVVAVEAIRKPKTCRRWRAISSSDRSVSRWIARSRRCSARTKRAAIYSRPCG